MHGLVQVAIVSTMIGLLTTVLDFLRTVGGAWIFVGHFEVHHMRVYLFIAVCQLHIRYELKRSNNPVALRLDSQKRQKVYSFSRAKNALSN